MELSTARESFCIQLPHSWKCPLDIKKMAPCQSRNNRENLIQGGTAEEGVETKVKLPRFPHGNAALAYALT